MAAASAAVTKRGIDVLAKAIPHAEVTGEYDAGVSAWTWIVVVPNPTDDDPDAKAGASRQFVSTEEAPEPTDEYLGLVATEIASTLPTGVPA